MGLQKPVVFIAIETLHTRVGQLAVKDLADFAGHFADRHGTVGLQQDFRTGITEGTAQSSTRRSRQRLTAGDFDKRYSRGTVPFHDRIKLPLFAGIELLTIEGIAIIAPQITTRQTDEVADPPGMRGFTLQTGEMFDDLNLQNRSPQNCQIHRYGLSRL